MLLQREAAEACPQRARVTRRRWRRSPQYLVVAVQLRLVLTQRSYLRKTFTLRCSKRPEKDNTRTKTHALRLALRLPHRKRYCQLVWFRQR